MQGVLNTTDQKTKKENSSGWTCRIFGHRFEINGTKLNAKQDNLKYIISGDDCKKKQKNSVNKRKDTCVTNYWFNCVTESIYSLFQVF